MPTFQCNICKGQGHVQTPTGALWQKCPLCEGAGQVTPEPGKEPAWYPLQLVVALNATATGVIQIQSDDFLLEALLATYTNALLAITILEGGKPWTKSPTLNVNAGTIPITLLAGTAQNWFPIYPAYRIKAKEQITITATDSSGAQNTLNFAMFGKALKAA